MRNLKKLKRVAKLLTKPHYAFGRAEYIFVVSHMRSRSTMFSHVLGSHVQICGYREQHRSYKSSLDLIRMRIDLMRDHEQDLRGKFLLDKLLHNKYLLEPPLLNTIPARIIYLLREPVGTLNSYFGLAELTGNPGYLDQKDAEFYYCNRLEWILEQHKNLSTRHILVDSDRLVLDSQSQLEEISSWLGLAIPLSKKYDVFENTGDLGAGDPSENIRAGQIKETTGAKLFEIEPGVIARCTEVYLRCKETLTA